MLNTACDACSPNQMADLATRTIDQGTVYVFDADFARVGKYAVVREVLDVEPREVWVQANPLSVEQSIRKAWSAYLDESGALEDEAVIDLPVDFGIRSVAGALQSPGFSTTSIEDFLASWSTADRNALWRNMNQCRLRWESSDGSEPQP